MPSHAAANPAIQQMYVNGHFCYAYKFGIVTNGLGIVRDIRFYNKDFLKSHLRCGLPTMKFVCPKMKWKWDNITQKSKRVCHCDSPCTTSSCGRMIYIYPEQNLRAYPRCVRGTDDWISTYKVRVNVEKAINHFKDSFCVADKLHKHQYIRNLKPLIA